MSKRKSAVLFLFFLIPSTQSLVPVFGEMAAGEIVDRANALLRGDASRGRFSLTVVTPDWERTIDAEGWHQGRDKALILIHGPAKDKGTATLRIKSEMWIWLAKVERVIKIPPSMMHSSWMGSDINYEDIIKADSVFKDYAHKTLEVQPREDHKIYKIEAIPKPQAPVVWGKIVLWCAVYENGEVIPLREEDYSERGELIRLIEMSQVKVMGGRRVPARMEVRPLKKPGQKTVVRYRALEFDVSFPENFFSLTRLQKREK